MLPPKTFLPAGKLMAGICISPTKHHVNNLSVKRRASAQCRDTHDARLAWVVRFAAAERQPTGGNPHSVRQQVVTLTAHDQHRPAVLHQLTQRPLEAVRMLEPSL